MDHPSEPTRRALVTQHHMVELAGSEVLTLELAEALRERGFEVTVYAHVLGDPIARIARERGVFVTTSDAALRAADADLVWIHHQMIPASLAHRSVAERAAVVFGHMSSFEPLELPVLADIEARLADVVVANSSETADVLRGFGLGALPIVVLGNPAPERFWRAPRARTDSLRTLVVVSNHPPAELGAAMERLRGEGVMVEFVGGGAARTEVTPHTLLAADAVVTVGKTVQYALAVGRAVFCYDVHGGPGWLSSGNLAVARRHNFSGRPYGRMSAGDIARSLLGGFERANAEVDALRDATSDLTWQNGLDAVFAAAGGAKGARRPLTPAELSRVQASLALSARSAREHHDLAVAAASERDLAGTLAAREKLIDQQRRELGILLGSRSWGLTAPLRSVAAGVRQARPPARSSPLARRLFRRAPEVIRDESLPALAWICRVSRRSARMVVGPQVEVSSRGISEGAWVGPFRHESLGDSPCVFGSGVVFDDDGCVFVPPSHPREALYVLEDRREGVSHVSNSLCFALTRLPGGVFERFLTSLRPTLWDTVSRALARGVVEKGAVDLHSDAGYRLSRLSFLRFRLSGAGRPVVVPDGGPHHFPDFRTYRDYLSHSLGDLFANAADAERSHSLHPLVALSSGYDSTAVAVLAAENGCRTAATIDVAVYGKPDSGQATASRLGLDVVSRAHVMGASIEQLNGAVEPAVGALAVEFLATDGIGDDVIFLPFEPELRQGMLLTGHWGDTLWSRDARVGSAMPVASPFRRSLTEFRLRVGFANVPVPYIGGRSGDSIGRISRSGEMAAFSVGGDYDRPIPRRIGEEAGLDRSGFGTEKVATAPLFTDGAAHFVDAVAAVSRRYAWVAL